MQSQSVLLIEKSVEESMSNKSEATINLSQIKIESSILEECKLDKLSATKSDDERKYWQPKLVLNIRKEKDFKIYAEIARKILLDRKEKCITLTSCGIAIVNLLKVSSALSHFIPGLHKVSRFI